MWEPKTAQDESIWTEGYAKLVISSHARRPFPCSTQRIGSVEAGWHEPTPGRYHVHATGGTVDDRRLARAIVAGELDAYGLQPISFTVGGPMLRKTASWDEVQQKAIRLMNDGNVQILRNASDIVVGHVIGDHGEYQTEISRQSPDSQVIDHWTCECWLPGTLVVMGDGTRKAIENIEAGDRVLTATGHVGVVRRAMQRQYEGDVYGMKIQGSTETWWATATHRLFNPQYDPVEAQAISAGDYLYMPVLQVDGAIQGFDTKYLFSDRVEIDGWLYQPNKLFKSKRVSKGSRPIGPVNRRVRPVRKTWDWNETLMRFLGLYAAEGMVTPRGEIRLSFGPREHGLVDEACEALRLLGCEPFVKFKKHAWEVAAQHSGVGRVLKTLVGTGSRTKRLHPSIMQAPVSMVTAFVSGWVDGDGYESEDGRTTLATASDNLAMQARLILSRLGVSSVIRVRTDNSSALVPGGMNINYIVWRTDGIDKRKIRYVDATGVNQRMCQPDVRPYSGLVFNIEVGADIGDHSYVIGDGIASANCPWDQFAWQRTRQWKNMEGRPCAHVLATHWYAQGVPLDQEFDPATGQPIAPSGPGGQIGLPMPLPNAVRPGGPSGPPMPAGGPQAPSQQLSIPGIDPGIATATPPVPPGPAILPPMPVPPMPVPVSVPGAKVPDASNPMQWPGGTFSKVAEWDFDDGELDGYKFVWDHATHRGVIYNMKDGLKYHGALKKELGGAGPFSGGSITPDGIIDVAFQGTDEGSSDMIRWLEAQGFRLPANDQEVAYADKHGWKIAATGDTFQNGDMVRINSDEYGVAEGKSEEHGAGQWRTIKKNSIGEVLGQDQTTGWVDVIFPIHDSGPMEPYHIRAWIEPANLTPMPNVKKPGPFLRRKR